MKKHIISKLLGLVLVVAMIFSLVACNQTPTTYSVTFDVQGHGTAPATQTVTAGGHATEPTAPSETGWTFGGWYKEAGCDNQYVFATEVVNENTIVYAKWTPVTTPPAGEDPTPLPTDKTPTLYLAGDSTVQTYKTEQYIAGWGQYLSYFLGSEVKVVNAAKGGRSSRSFINEDRLFTDTDGTKYNFKENDGKSIEECIKAGDFLFVQFGHNDDDTKGYGTMPDRMVPLGTPDANGIYPTTAPEGKKPTTYLPQKYIDKATASEKTTVLSTIAKYGSEYYAYGDGTYKWYLKQYIDLAREKGAIPVLLTPVARVSFNSDGTLKSGAGLHGEDFAYVKAVRQLAEEENCLLIDNFAATKTMLETVTKSDSDFLMALVDNDALTGEWPVGYDDTYANPEKYSSYTKVEGTHYNKYGAYLTAAYVTASILGSNASNTVKGVNGTQEYFTFGSHVKITPNTYINPSYLMSKSKVALVEALSIFGDVNVTDPERTYPDPATVVTAITGLTAVEVTAANYEARTTAYNTVKALYNTVNSEDRSQVTNYNDLLEYGANILNVKIAAQLTGDASTVVTASNYKQYNATCKALRAEYSDLSSSLQAIVTNVSILAQFEAAVENNQPQVTSTVVLDLSSLTLNSTITSSVTCGDFKIVGASGKAITVKGGTTFTYNNQQYSTGKSLSMGGSATFGSSRYIEFTTDKVCRITVVAKSTGSDARTVNLVSTSATSNVITTFAAGAGAQSITTYDDLAAGTYQLGSAGSGIYIYSIIIEYFS